MALSIGFFMIFTFFAPIFSIPTMFVANDPVMDFPFVTRQQWDAVPSTDTRPLHKPVTYAVIHHTYLPAACYTETACAKAMRSMQNYHNELGWGDIGYNFCVGSNGVAYEGRGWDVIGIHTGKANNFSIGICLIGDWRKELPPPQQLETTKSLIAYGVKLGAIKDDYKLIAHKQVMATECPGEALFEEISHWDHFTPRVPTDPIITRTGVISTNS